VKGADGVGLLSLVHRILLHREDSAGLVRADLVKSKFSLNSPVVEGVEGFLAEERPKNTEDPSSTPARVKAIETPRDPTSETQTTVPKDSLDMPTEFMAIVQRLEGLFTQDQPKTPEDRPLEGQGSSTPLRVEAVEDPESIAEPKADTLDNFSIPSEFVAPRSVKLSSRDAMTYAQSVYWESKPTLKNHTERRERHATPRLSSGNNVPRKLEQLQADAAVTGVGWRPETENQHFVAEAQGHFMKIGGSEQTLVDDTEKRLAVTVQSLLDSFLRAAIEEMRAELNASKTNVIKQTQEELASMSRAWFEPLTRDLIEQARTELAASRRVFIEEAQNQLAKMISADPTNSNEAFIDKVQKQVAAMTELCVLETAYKARRRAAISCADR